MAISGELDRERPHPCLAGSPRTVGPAVERTAATRLIRVIGLALSLAYGIALAGSSLQGDFLVDAQRRPIANDFVGVWAAGRLALDGHPAAAYDWPAHRTVEVAGVGHDFDGYYGWHYPPTFLFVAAALATLPYVAAAVAWLAATFAACAAALGTILGRRTGWFFALGFPAAIWNVTAGQNGFLTAALIGGTLGLMERRPVWAGVCLGLLTYKPQFGLLFPLVLIADRRWWTMATAAAVALGLAAVSWLVFGAASWQAFVHWMPITSHVVLGEGHADFARLQSVFGLIRAHGGSEHLAWIVQGCVSIALAAGLVVLWRSPADFDLKAAALAAGTLLATPYLYMYDVVILAVAVAFLLRHALRHGFIAAEIAALACAGALILIFPYVKTQVGLAAVAIVFSLVTRRVLAPAGPQAA